MTNIFRQIAITIIKTALWLIDSDHRNSEEIAADNMKKFTHIVDHNFKSDFGTVKQAFRTVPYEAWELCTTTKRLLAADKHRVMDAYGEAVWIEDLKPGDKILTDSGIEEVTVCRNLHVRTHMYCVNVETDDPEDLNNHLYYTDGILSHNTTCSASYLLWKALFTADATILITANKMVQAIEIMDKIRHSYENLPDHIRAGILEYNKSAVRFDNGSRIIARATSADSARGLAVTLVYADEAAFVPRNISNAFFTSLAPTLSTGGGIIVSSTPISSDDAFSALWRGAIKTVDEYGNDLDSNGEGINGYFGYKAIWSAHPDRDQKWADQYRAELGVAKFAQEMECAFVTGDDSLVDSFLLEKMTFSEPIQYTGTTRWYQKPEPNKTYLIALDPSLGVGGDSAAIEVFQLPEMRQIAEWQHNKSAPRQQVTTLIQILVYLEQTLLDNDEQNGEPELYWTVENNSIGEAILTIIDDTGLDKFPGQIISEPRKSGSVRHRKGLTTTNKSKLSACARLKSLLETGRMSLKSKNLISELKTFSAYENTFKAKPGYNDDLVSATLMIVRMLETAMQWSEYSERMDDLKENIDEDDLENHEFLPFLHSDYK